MTALRLARKLGNFLLQAQAEVHAAGENWTDWIPKFDGGRTTLFDYMKIAREWEEIAEELQDRPTLSIDGALKILRGSKPPPSRHDLFVKALVKSFEGIVSEWGPKPVARLAGNRDRFMADIETAAKSLNREIYRTQKERAVEDLDVEPEPEEADPTGPMINRQELIRELRSVEPGTSWREYIEQSSCFVFHEGRIKTFNDELSYSRPTRLGVTGAIPAVLLLKHLESLPDDEIRFEEKEKGVDFQGYRKKSFIERDPIIHLPLDRVESPQEWIPISKEFLKAMERVRPFAGKDETRFMLTCIHIHPEWVETCDNVQMMRIRLQTGVKTSMMIRATSAEALVREKWKEMSIVNDWVHFRKPDGMIGSCRKYSEDPKDPKGSEGYPSLDRVLDHKDPYRLYLSPEVVKACVRTRVFFDLKNEDPLVRVCLRHGRTTRFPTDSPLRGRCHPDPREPNPLRAGPAFSAERDQ